MPAYLADIFGTQFVGAIHGRLLTIGKGGLDAKAALFWALVGVPLAWGV